MGQAPSGTSKKSTEAFTSRTAAIRSSGTFSRKRPLRIGTIRKKLARTLRGGRNPDYKRHMRELLETWSLKDISGLVQEYESLSSLKEIIANSDLTRQSVPNLRKDLSDLYEKQCYTDIVLEYKGSFFPVHQAIVSRRCPFFEKKLTGLSEAEKTIKIDLDVSYIDTQIFSLLIKFLYTGECHSDNVDNEAVLKKLGEKFGMPKSLDKDLKSLLENETLTDIILVFPSKTNAETCSNKDNSTTDIDSSLEFKCHGAILCARSRYFRSLLTRISKTQNFKSTAKKPLRITVDETMLPRQYVPVVLQCMYLDCIDLHSIIKWKSSDEGNGNGEADKLLTTSEIAMELFEIGKFLDFPALSQACEDIIIEDLSSFSLVGVLDWSCQSFGSNWVYRQALQYLREEFLSITKSSSILANLPKIYLIEAVKSDFLQASEEEILAIVIRWGEWQVSKTIDKQRSSSPERRLSGNLLKHDLTPGSHASPLPPSKRQSKGGMTTNSLNRRSPKRKDISEEALLEAITDILPYIRVNHIIPRSSVILQSAYHRNLLSKPFPLDVGSSNDIDRNTSLYWVREINGRRHHGYTRPRLFLPYFEEAKAVMSENMLSEGNLAYLRTTRLTTMPDMLPEGESIEGDGLLSEHTLERYKSYSADIVHVDGKTIRAMLRRERELKMTSSVQKAFALSFGDSQIVNSEVQKRVMREFGFPDSLACEIFRHAPDLIEDSSSSSGSSRHSTLNKVSHTGNEGAVAVAAAPDVTIPASETPPHVTFEEEPNNFRATEGLLDILPDIP